MTMHNRDHYINAELRKEVEKQLMTKLEQITQNPETLDDAKEDLGQALHSDCLSDFPSDETIKIAIDAISLCQAYLIQPAEGEE